MIKSHKQAVAIQTHRANSGKRGYAKAVRCFLRRKFPNTEQYNAEKAKLPVKRPLSWS